MEARGTQMNQSELNAIDAALKATGNTYSASLGIPRDKWIGMICEQNNEWKIAHRQWQERHERLLAEIERLTALETALALCLKLLEEWQLLIGTDQSTGIITASAVERTTEFEETADDAYSFPAIEIHYTASGDSVSLSLARLAALVLAEGDEYEPK